MAEILVIEDNATMREGMVATLRKLGHQVRSAANGRDGIQRFAESPAECVLTDLKMPDISGLDVLARIKSRDTSAAVVVVTAYGTIDTAVEAMKKGAFDFITKPFSRDLLRAKVSTALEHQGLSEANRRLATENELLKADRDGDAARPEMVGNSSKMVDLFAKIAKVAASDSTVLITGESGTGKELVARAIHDQSHRAAHPFVRVNCSAFAEGVLESELFGHEKGSFTGAHEARRGRFELADRGTVFLDEVGDMNSLVQLKLLGVLQEREFERVGGTRSIQTDVRVLCATHRDLPAEIEAGRFREDFFYRINTISLRVPTLRERLEDLPALTEHLLRKLRSRARKDVAGIDEAALQALQGYHWPGNVRELENVIEQAMVLCECDRISDSDLPRFAPLRGPFPDLTPLLEQESLDQILAKVEKSLVAAAYDSSRQVKAETARALGIKTSALYYKLEKYGLI